MKDYESKVIAASKELNAIESAWIASNPDAMTVEEACAGNRLLVDVDFTVTVKIHNERARDNKEYDCIYIVDKTGMVYKSGSNSLINSISEIQDALFDMGKTISDVTLEIVPKPSRNYNGKYFFKASVSLASRAK